MSRLVGVSMLDAKVEYVLFLDVDEIPEGRRFATWLKEFPLKEYSALRMACYWYFRSSQYRAGALEDTPLLVQKKVLTYDALMHAEERAGTFHSIEGEKMRFVSQEAPLFHHYSWVRSKEEMLRKVCTWGHRNEREWAALVEEEFSRPFSGKDFVHGYTFQEVPPFLKPVDYSNFSYVPSAVIRLTVQELLKLDLAMLFEV
jgi:hypothetical protein